MPLYEYYCANCQHQLEVLQKFTDEALITCPQCHQSTLEKQVSATSFQLKGTGWYATDFKDKGKVKPTSDTTTKPAASDATSTSSEGAKDGASGDKGTKAS